MKLYIIVVLKYVKHEKKKKLLKNEDGVSNIYWM